MYRYEQPSMFSGTRGLVFIAVILLHLLLGYALVNGLGAKIVQVIIPPVEIAQIDKPKVNLVRIEGIRHTRYQTVAEVTFPSRPTCIDTLQVPSSLLRFEASG